MKAFAVAVASLIAIASGIALASDCSINAAKALPWERFGDMKSPYSPPVVVTYRGCGRTLTYVAAEHSNDPAGKTFTLVKRAFEQAQAKIAVLEGFPAKMGENPKPLIEHSGRVANTPGDAEPYLAVRISQTKGMKFTGAEPEDSDILVYVRTKGLSTSDLFGLYVLRQIGQWRREEKISRQNDPKLEALIANYAPAFARDAAVDLAEFKDVATLEGFQSWYKKTNGLDFATDYRPEDAWPPSPKSARNTNAQIAILSNAREAHILSVIDASLKKYDNVLVVYGFSHHDIQAPALEAAFGKPSVMQ